MPLPRYESARTVANPAALPFQQAVGQAEIARGINQIGQAGVQINDAQDRANKLRDIAFVSNQTAQDRLALNQQLEDLQTSAPPDGAGVTGSILKAIDTQEQVSLTAAPSDQARVFLQQHYAELRTSLGVQAQHFEATSRGQWTAQQFSDAADASATYLATNPGDLNRVMNETNIQIDAIGTAGAMHPARVAELKKKTNETLVTAAVAGAIQTNPLAALSSLSTGALDQYLTPERKIALINQSLSQYTELQNHAYTEQQRREKDLNDVTAREALLLGPQLTTQWLAAHVNALDPTTYRALESRIGKGAIATNPALYAELRSSVDDPNTPQRATQEYLAGHVEQGDYDRIMSAANGSTPGSVYKQGEDYIKANLAKSPYDMGSSGFSFGQQQTAEALDSYNRWFEAHKDATPEQVRERYLGIVAERQVIDAQQLGIITPLPRYHVGSRRDLNVGSTFKATQKALADGEITQAEYEDQAKLLDIWDNVIVPHQLQAAEDAAKAAKK